MCSLVALLLLVCASSATDVVLSRAPHGAQAHRDVIACVQPDARLVEHAPLFAPEPLLELFLLPSALWCDTDTRNASLAAVCHDRTMTRVYSARMLVCAETAAQQSVRCTAQFDCAPLLAECYASVGATLACIVALIGGRMLCVGDVERRRDAPPLGYDKDRAL